MEINDNRFADQKKNYLLWHALCQWTVVRSCKSLMCTRHTLTWHAQEIVTCWVSERISLQLLREAQKCPTKCLAPQQTGTSWFQVSWMAKTHCYSCYFSALQSLDWDLLPTQKLAIFGIPQNWRNIRIWLFLLLAFQSNINSQCPQTTSWGSYSIPQKVCWKKGWVKVTTFLSSYYYY